MKKSIKILIILIVVACLAIGGYFAYDFLVNGTEKKTVSDNKNKNDKKDSKDNDSSKDKTTEPVSLDLFGDYYDEASKLMKGMSVEEKVGQIFLVRYSYDDTVLNEVSKYHTGGYILFARDYGNETVKSIKGKMDHLQSTSKIPLTIATDEEGGTVTRVSRYAAFRSSKFDSPQNIFNNGGYDLLEKTEKEKAALLKSVGVNLNLAPVSDVSTDSNDYINARSFGKNGSETATYITNMVNYANESGISSCLKHFPGYGNNVDTHTGIAIDNRSMDSFRNNDFLPIIAGIKANVPAVLVSHNVVNAMDSELPSSLSKKVHDILRNELGFTGVVMTDDLAMDAVKAYTSNGEAATLALNAGNDLIITSDLANMYNEVLNNVNNGTISMDTLNMAVKRVIAWKYAYGLF